MEENSMATLAKSCWALFDKVVKIVPKENNEVQQAVKVLKDFKTIKNIKKGSEVAS